MFKYLTALLTRLKRRRCDHLFAIEDLSLTGIDMPDKPTKGGYLEWRQYFSDIYVCDGHTKRVRWPCSKCGKVFFAHCGLDITPEHGPMMRRDAESYLRSLE